jgi:tetratricopeptide (TPR) repeat protein
VRSLQTVILLCSIFAGLGEIPVVQHCLAADSRPRAEAPKLLLIPQELERLEQRAVTLFQQEKFEEARNLHTHFLNRLLRQVPADHWRVAVSQNRNMSLARLCALPDPERAVATQAVRDFSSGVTHFSAGKLTAAQPLLASAVLQWQKVFGADSIFTADFLEMQASCEGMLNELTSSASLFKESLSVRQSLFGENHPTCAATLSSLGQVSMRLGNYEEAETQLLDALKIRHDRLGPDSVDYVGSLQNVALVYLAKNDASAASRYAEEAVEIATRTLPAEHLVAILSKWQLAKCRVAQGKPEESCQIYSEIVVEFEKRDCTVPATNAAIIVDAYVQALRLIGRMEDAERYATWSGQLRLKGCGVALSMPKETR